MGNAQNYMQDCFPGFGNDDDLEKLIEDDEPLETFEPQTIDKQTMVAKKRVLSLFDEFEIPEECKKLTIAMQFDDPRFNTMAKSESSKEEVASDLVKKVDQVEYLLQGRNQKKKQSYGLYDESDFEDLKNEVKYESVSLDFATIFDVRTHWGLPVERVTSKDFIATKKKKREPIPCGISYETYDDEEDSHITKHSKKIEKSIVDLRFLTKEYYETIMVKVKFPKVAEQLKERILENGQVIKRVPNETKFLVRIYDESKVELCRFNILVNCFDESENLLGMLFRTPKSTLWKFRVTNSYEMILPHELKITINEGAEFVNSDPNQSVNSICKVFALKMKEKRTSIAKASRSPTWEDSFLYTIPPDLNEPRAYIKVEVFDTEFGKVSELLGRLQLPLTNIFSTGHCKFTSHQNQPQLISEKWYFLETVKKDVTPEQKKPRLKLTCQLSWS